MKCFWFRILCRFPLSYSQSGQGTEGDDISYFAADQVESGLHSNSLLTLRAAPMKKIDRAMENCVATLPKQNLDFRFNRSGPLPIMEFVFTSPCWRGVSQICWYRGYSSCVVSNFIPRCNTGLELLSYLHLIMGSHAPITSQVHRNIRMNKIPYTWFSIFFQHFHMLSFHLLLAMADF